MTDLIARLEAAPEGSRGLDYEIHCLMYEACGAYGPHPHYTTSLDAAMTLVPEGCWYSLGTRNPGEPHDAPWATVWNDLFVEANSNAATPALALCAAAMKAQGHE